MTQGSVSAPAPLTVALPTLASLLNAAATAPAEALSAIGSVVCPSTVSVRLPAAPVWKTWARRIGVVPSLGSVRAPAVT